MAGHAKTAPRMQHHSDRSLRGLIDQIRAHTSITRITGHNDHAAKACPGFVLRNWINRA